MLNVVSSSLAGGMESTLSEFGDDTKLAKVAVTLEGKAAVQGAFSRLTGTS